MKRNKPVINLCCFYCIEQLWMDYKLQWDPAEYDNISILRVPSKMIWTPDLVLYNK